LEEANKSGKVKSGLVPAGGNLHKNGIQQISWDLGTVTSYALYANYPNPFNPSTTVQFDVPKDGYVSLKVFDYLGKEVRKLVSSELASGRHQVSFDAPGLASGVYFYRLQAGTYVETRRLCLVR
jgi:hypothetical protein